MTDPKKTAKTKKKAGQETITISADGQKKVIKDADRLTFTHESSRIHVIIEEVGDIDPSTCRAPGRPI